MRVGVYRPLEIEANTEFLVPGMTRGYDTAKRSHGLCMRCFYSLIILHVFCERTFDSSLVIKYYNFINSFLNLCECVAVLCCVGQPVCNY